MPDSNTGEYTYYYIIEENKSMKEENKSLKEENKKLKDKIKKLKNIMKIFDNCIMFAFLCLMCAGCLCMLFMMITDAIMGFQFVRFA